MAISRNTLCFLSAGVLAAAALALGIVRHGTVGGASQAPPGAGRHHVTLVVRGKCKGEAKLLTACPLDFHRQHVYDEKFTSPLGNAKLIESRPGDRRHLHWTLRPGSTGALEARYEFHVTTEMVRPNGGMARLGQLLHQTPAPGQDLHASPGIDPSEPEITQNALDVTGGLVSDMDLARALFQFVNHKIAKEPGAGGQGITALDCLQAGRGDALAQSRLLAALCRNRGLPARLVNGLILRQSSEQKPHVWVEAWVGDHWMALCPFHQHCGKVPGNYLVFGYGDLALVRGHDMAELDYAYLVEPSGRARAQSVQPSPVRRFFQSFSLLNLPRAEYHLVEFLLLLPLAALIICVFRNLVGLQSFGTFTPALIGLAFRELDSLPGAGVFVALILLGWGVRSALDKFHLLQVPRVAFLLSLVTLVLVVLIVAANDRGYAVTRYFSLFPMIILTGLIERFWTVETEDGAWTSFKTLLTTLFMAAVIGVTANLHVVVRHLTHYPETVGLIMACQLLLGRYTGYRLLELWRFRDLVREEPPTSIVSERLATKKAGDRLKLMEMEDEVQRI